MHLTKLAGADHQEGDECEQHHRVQQLADPACTKQSESQQYSGQGAVDAQEELAGSAFENLLLSSS